METKIFELLAPGTKGAAIAIKLTPLDGTEGRIASSVGFGSDGDAYFLVGTLKSSPNFMTYDKFHWLRGDGGVERSGMMYLVHDEVESRWDEMTSGDALDLTPRWREVQDMIQQLLDG